MALFMILGVVVLLTFIVLGVLFFMLNKEGHKKEEESAVPVADLDQLKKELSGRLFEQKDLNMIEKDSEIIPVFTPKVSLPTQENRTPLEDEAYKKRAKELEDELLAISKKAAGQSDEAKQMIENLTKENESLKAQYVNLEQAQQKLVELKSEASDLRLENTGLQTQLETTNAKVRLLEDQMAAFQVQMGDEISRANATVAQLNKDKEAMAAAIKPPDVNEGLLKELESVKTEQVELKRKYEELENDQKRLRELNTRLMEKSDALQYELIKARAQSSGLERVSFNYKNQVEDFLKQVNAMQSSNEQLSEVKNRLEGMVQEVKSQNEELAKKDQLVQFELEKNRSRLLSLEREYEDYKARTQQQNQQ